jgi:hypothetical protein
MDLQEAVERAKSDVSEWSMQVVTNPAASAQVFELVAYGDVVKNLVVKFCSQLGEEVTTRIWPKMSEEPDADARFALLAETCQAEAIKGCTSFFAIGWMMGAPENVAKPKTRETFLSVMKSASKDELRLLEVRFAAEQFLIDRWTHSLNSAGMMISKIFSEQGADMTEQTIAQWCSIVSSLPMFEAYELGTRSRLLIEEELTMKQIESEFNTE